MPVNATVELCGLQIQRFFVLNCKRNNSVWNLLILDKITNSLCICDCSCILCVSLSLSLSRYIVFLSPHDIGYSLCLTTPIQLILYMIEEFARAKKVFSGVTMAAAVYPKSLLAMAVVGMLKGELGLSLSPSLSPW